MMSSGVFNFDAARPRTTLAHHAAVAFALVVSCRNQPRTPQNGGSLGRLQEPAGTQMESCDQNTLR
jgi:hypothetical protein